MTQETYDNDDLIDMERLLNRMPDEDSHELINKLYRKIQVLETQVNAYRKRLNSVEAARSIGSEPCSQCKKSLLFYCPRCDK